MKTFKQFITENSNVGAGRFSDRTEKANKESDSERFQHYKDVHAHKNKNMSNVHTKMKSAGWTHVGSSGERINHEGKVHQDHQYEKLGKTSHHITMITASDKKAWFISHNAARKSKKHKDRMAAGKSGIDVDHLSSVT